MPTISKIRFTNAIYEGGLKRYNDNIFEFDGYNGAIILENGGGKTVFVQLALQAILPNIEVAGRKLIETITLDSSPAHIAIEWIINDRPRRYVTTAITLFIHDNAIKSYKYVYEYPASDLQGIVDMPFVKENEIGEKRASSQQEIYDYYTYMDRNYTSAKYFSTNKDFHSYIENNYKIIPSEWRKIADINANEGDVEKFFEKCNNTTQLVNQLLIPVVEEAIAGESSKLFIETFKSQRENFKKHKQLRKSIEESKIAKRCIEDYANLFSKYNKVIKEVNEKKVVIKTLYNMAQGILKSNEDKYSQLDAQMLSLRKKQEDIEYKEKSRELLEYKKAYEDIENEYKRYFKEQEDNKNNYKQLESKLYALNIAECRHQIKTVNDRIMDLQLKLKELDEDFNIEEIKNKLEENSENIKGYFLNEIEKIEKSLSSYLIEKEKYEDEKMELSNQIASSQNEKFNKDKEIIRIEEQLNNIKKNMEQIEKEILDNIEIDKVKDKYDLWLKESRTLETTIIENKEKVAKLKEEQNFTQKKLDKLTFQLTEKEKSLSRIKTKREELEKVQRRQMNKLIEEGIVGHVTSLYEKEEQLKDILLTKVNKATRDKENALKEERRVTRLLDTYNDKNYYTADPLLVEIVEKIKSSFDYVEAGTTYYNKNLSFEDTIKNYPYWSISIITFEDEVDKLSQILKNYTNQITHPIMVITLEDIKKGIDKREATNHKIIVPDIWINQLDHSNFEQWKKSLDDNSKEVIFTRKKSEEKLRKYHLLYEELCNFFTQYPYELYQQIVTDETALQQYVNESKLKIDNYKIVITELENSIKEYDRKIVNGEHQSFILGEKLDKAIKYFNYQKEADNKEKQRYLAKDDINKITNLIRKLEYELGIKNNHIEEIKQLIYDTNRNLERYQDDELYKEVKINEGKYNNFTLEFLKKQRFELKDELSNRQKDRPTLENDLKEEKNKKAYWENELESKIAESRDRFQEIDFPSDGKNQQRKLIDKINDIKDKIKDIQPVIDKLHVDYVSRKTTYENEEKAFKKTYDDVYTFNDNLERVKKIIKEEKDKLLKEIEKVNKVQITTKKVIDEIKDIINQLDTHNRYHQFLADSIKTIIPTEEMERDFPYDMLGYINDHLEQLRKLQQELDEEKSKLQDEKLNIIKNLEQQLDNIKLKKMIKDGLDYKQNYKDLVEWKGSIDKRIEHTIKIHEDHLREQDKQMQQYINHIHAFLKEVAHELSEIPKKTSIKVENNWKQIFEFNIPTWDENDGKETIRDYIDWIVNELELDKYKAEDGNENESLVNTSLEKWLNTKQLLHKVMKDTIKVKCRKVTNDNKIKGQLASWESSNKWSGGEKWCKNMTLFLGMLNYLAEKKQHIQKGEKRNRTVIVDNPFGKASSEHVLDPVFFIAEKLGFQIIALTAHASGKFIRDYFPIVYSCRLRKISGSDKQIMNTKKNISYAYFKDNDPILMERLGEKEQISLF